MRIFTSKRIAAGLSLAVCLVLLQPLSAWIHKGAESLDEHDHASEASAAEEAKQLYTCSMHPFIIQDKPGTCPICGMDLVPVRERPARKEDEPEQGQDKVITIDPATRQNMGVRTAIVEERQINRTLRTVGIVGYDEALQYTVNTKIDGWIDKLYVNKTGEKVKKGQPLLDIYSPDLVTAQEEFLLAVRNNSQLAETPFPAIAQGAKSLLAASRKRLLYWDISEAQIDDLAASGEIRKTMTLYAQHDGVVTKKSINEGAFVRAGTELLQISDLAKIWIYADIYEYELPWVEVGQKAEIHFPYARPPIYGTVRTIYPYVEAKTRTVKARIDIDNSSGELKPDMFVNIVLDRHGRSKSLAVPVEAVLRSGKEQTVFVALGDGRFEPRSVKTGLESDDGFIQVLDGLHEKERVVTSAQFMFDSESRLKEAISKLTSTTGEPSSKTAKNESAMEENLNDLFE
jgi:RND family efflux transporter MFP subunit